MRLSPTLLGLVAHLRSQPAPGFKVVGRSTNSHDPVWSPTSIAEPETIEALVAVYHDVVYPMCALSPTERSSPARLTRLRSFCFFHWPSFVEKVQNRVYLSNRALYASVMTVCSIAAARLRDGASLSTVKIQQSVMQQSEQFYQAAEEAIPTRLEEASLLYASF